MKVDTAQVNKALENVDSDRHAGTASNSPGAKYCIKTVWKHLKKVG